MRIVNYCKGNVPVLASPAMLSQMGGYLVHGYIVEEQLCLPFVMLRKKKFLKIIQLPVPIIGSCSQEKAHDFLNRAMVLLKKEYHPDIIMTLNTSPMQSYPDGAEYCKFGSYILDLSLSVEELFGKLHSKHRNVVRKAEKDGVVIDCGIQYMEDCIKLIEDTYRRQGKSPQSSAKYRTLSQLGEHCDWWVAKLNDDIQGCAILLWDDNTSYYMHGGSIASPHTGAINLLHWEAIKKMKERGVKKYDFVGARVNTEEGSKLEGIQRFKSRFGGDMLIGYRWEYYCNVFKSRLYKSALWIKARIIDHSKEPIGVINQERNRGNY